MPSNHARLSPSGATRWMGCPASLAAERGMPDKRTDHAQEGTAAHAVAEAVLKAINPLWRGKRPEFQRLTAADYIGETIENWLITDDMAPPIQQYIDAIMAIAGDYPLYIECRVDFSHIVGIRNSFGTADAVVIHGDELQIHDLKFGRGVRVSAVKNPQLMLYALGALRMFDLGHEFSTVRLFIHQPRLQHVSEWSLTVHELIEFGRTAKAAARKAIQLFTLAEDGQMLDEKDFNPSESACRWCKAAAVCKAYAQRVYNEVAREFVDIEAAEFSACHPERLTNEQIAQAFHNLTFIENWCKRIAEEVHRRISSGNPVPGLKLVEGRPGNRRWKSEKEAEQALLMLTSNPDRVYQARKIITPTEAQKIFKKDAEAWESITPLFTRSPGAPVVAPESDPRATITNGCANDDEFLVVTE